MYKTQLYILIFCSFSPANVTYFLFSSCLLENRIPVTFITAQILLSLCILTTQL